MSLWQETGNNYKIKIPNTPSFSENVPNFKYFGITRTYKNLQARRNKEKMMFGKCLLKFDTDFLFLLFYVKHKDYNAGNYHLGSLRGYGLSVFENRVLRYMFGPNRQEAGKGCIARSLV
jgi:hypothetical protein